MTDAEMKEYILKHFTYRDGELVRDDRRNSSGSLDRDGYLVIKVKGKQFKAHRIVWLLHHGDFPKGEIDHINRNRTTGLKTFVKQTGRYSLKIWNTSRTRIQAQSGYILRL